MNTHKILTEAEYRAALKEASALVDSDPALETPEGNLTTLAPDIVAAILDDTLPNHITLFDLAVDRVTSPRSPVPHHCGIRRTCPPAASRHP